MSRAFRILIVAGLMAASAGFVFAEGSAEAASDQPAVVKWMMRWDNDRVETVAKPVIAAFQKANPTITVEFENIGKAADYYTKLTTLAAAGEMPDVTYLAPHYVAIYASKGAIAPIDSLLKSAKIDTAVFYQNVLNFYKRDGKVFGIPIDAAACCIFYNKKMFDEAGVPYPKKGWTWDDLRAMGQKFVKDLDGDGKPDQFAIHLRSEYYPIYLKAETDHTQFNDYFAPTEYRMTEPASVKALQDWIDMWLVQKISPDPAQTQQIKDYFMAGKAAMHLIGSWNMPMYINGIKDFTWDLAPMPIGKTGKEYQRGDGSAFALAATSKAPAAAFRFMTFVAGPGGEGVNILLDKQQMLPAIKTMAESDRFLKPDAKFTGGLTLNKSAYFFGNKNQFSMYDPIHPLYEKLNAVETSEFNEAFFGKVTAEVAIQRAAEQINKILKEGR